MPSTVKNVYELGFIDPYQTTNKDQNEWFRDIVLGNIDAYGEALNEYNEANAATADRLNDPWGSGTAQPGEQSGLGLASGVGTGTAIGAPQSPKYYTWLVNDLLKQYGEGETDPLKVWSTLTADQKDSLVADVGNRAMKDENAGSFLGNLLIKPTMPLTLLGPISSLGAGVGGQVATVGLTGSGGIGTILSNPLIGELGTGIVSAGSTVGGAIGGGGGNGEGSEDEPVDETEEEPYGGTEGGMEDEPKWWEDLGYDSKDEAEADGYVKIGGKVVKGSVAPDKDQPNDKPYVPPLVSPPPGVDPGSVPDEEEDDPDIIVPPDGGGETPEPDPPSNPFDAALGNMGLFFGQAGASRKPYVNVESQGEQQAPEIRHSDLVQSALSGAGIAPQAASSTQGRPSSLGIVEGVVPQETSQDESEEESILSKIRRRRLGLGLG